VLSQNILNNTSLLEQLYNRIGLTALNCFVTGFGRKLIILYQLLSLLFMTRDEAMFMYDKRT